MTIDALGSEEFHKQVAANIALSESLRLPLRDASLISKSAQISATTSSFSPELDRLLDTKRKNASFAHFSSPENFPSKTDLFSSFLSPSLGSIPIDKLKDAIEMKKSQKEGKTLLKFIEQFQTLNKFLTTINSKRDGTQKG